MARSIVTGIDIGTYTVKVVISELLKENAKNYSRIIGTGLVESKGLRHGYIINGAEVTESIKAAVKQAEKTAGVKVNKAYVAVGGIGLQGISSTGSIMTSHADNEITDLDIEKITDLAEKNIAVAAIANRKILHSIPLSYKIDGKLVYSKSPVGMSGTKLEAKILFVTCLESHLNDLLEAVEEASIDVIDVLAAPIAASFVTLTKPQKMVGCVLANIGAETISVVVFENNIPISLEVFQLGSTDITNDIALGLRIPLEEAESVKLGGTGFGQYPKKKLDEIINARLIDMFELVENHLKKIGRSGLLPAGIFITGGGSGLGTTSDLAKAVLKLPSRIGILNTPDKVKDSTWAVAYGLCMLGIMPEEKSSLGLKKDISSGGKKAFDWLKQFLP
jgi:cell division protein FtsA